MFEAHLGYTVNSRPAWAIYVMFKENVGYIVSGSQPGLFKKPVANLSMYQDPISKKSSMKNQELEMKSQVTLSVGNVYFCSCSSAH